jgi:hypothetical protein
MPTPALGHAWSAGIRRQERVKIDRDTADALRRQGLVKIASKEGARMPRFPVWWTHDGADERRDGILSR